MLGQKLPRLALPVLDLHLQVLVGLHLTAVPDVLVVDLAVREVEEVQKDQVVEPRSHSW